MHAHEVHAHKMHSHEMHPRGVHAHETPAHHCFGGSLAQTVVALSRSEFENTSFCAGCGGGPYEAPYSADLASGNLSDNVLIGRHKSQPSDIRLRYRFSVKISGLSGLPIKCAPR